MKSEFWREDALCRGLPNIMFIPAPRKGRPMVREYNKAKAVCDKCAVSGDCLSFALDNGFNEYGMYGGMTPAERRELLRRKVWQ